MRGWSFTAYSFLLTKSGSATPIQKWTGFNLSPAVVAKDAGYVLGVGTAPLTFATMRGAATRHRDGSSVGILRIERIGAVWNYGSIEQGSDFLFSAARAGCDTNP
jgi:hypothetical protein